MAWGCGAVPIPSACPKHLTSHCGASRWAGLAARLWHTQYIAPASVPPIRLRGGTWVPGVDEIRDRTGWSLSSCSELSRSRASPGEMVLLTPPPSEPTGCLHTFLLPKIAFPGMSAGATPPRLPGSSTPPLTKAQGFALPCRICKLCTYSLADMERSVNIGG